MSIILKKLRSSDNLIYIAFASAFLPFILTGLVLVGLGIYLLLAKRDRVFVYNGKVLFVIFTVYTAIIGLLRDNLIGFCCSVGFFFVFVISYYVRSEVTGDVFQKSLDLSCWMCFPVCISTIAEKLSHSHVEDYRCQSWFFNANYLCTMMAMMIVVCTYKLLITSKGKPFYLLTILACSITMYLGESIFAIIEVGVGIFTLLILYKKRSILITSIAIAGIAAIMLYINPGLFPRILNSSTSTDQRIYVWDQAIEFIKISPFFGHGFMSYYHLQEIHGSLWTTAHTHNFIFEPLLCFGIVGTVMFVAFLWTYYEKISECKSLLRKNKAANLILALSAAIIIHCTVDLTVLWIQTGLLFALIIGCIGVDEKALNRRIKACLGKKTETENTTPKEDTNNEQQ